MKILNSRLGLLAAAGLMAATFTVTASAQDTNLMRFHIPFAFLAGEQTMPAGDYLIRVDSRFNLVDILPKPGNKQSRLILQSTSVSRPNRGSELGLLTFVKYGDKLVLRGVWADGRTDGHDVKTSKAELELVRSTGGTPTEVESVAIQ